MPWLRRCLTGSTAPPDEVLPARRRHRVVASARAGATAQQPPGRQPEPAAQSVRLQRLARILRTAGRVATASSRPFGTDLLLVEPDGGHRAPHPPRFRGALTRERMSGSRKRAANDRGAQQGQLRTTTDHLGQAAAGLEKADVTQAGVAAGAVPGPSVGSVARPTVRAVAGSWSAPAADEDHPANLRDEPGTLPSGHSRSAIGRLG